MTWHHHADPDAQESPLAEAVEVLMHTIHEQGATIMATLADIQAKLDQLTTQEAGETTVAPGMVAVAQSDLDALDAHVQSLLDKPATPPPGP